MRTCSLLVDVVNNCGLLAAVRHYFNHILQAQSHYLVFVQVLNNDFSSNWTLKVYV
jgi:hypothetical protein